MGEGGGCKKLWQVLRHIQCSYAEWMGVYNIILDGGHQNIANCNGTPIETVIYPHFAFFFGSEVLCCVSSPTPQSFTPHQNAAENDTPPVSPPVPPSSPSVFP